MAEPSETDRSDELRRWIIDIAIRLGLLALVAYWCLLLLGPFIPIIVWGAILAVALYPAYVWLGRTLGGRTGLAATLIVCLMLVVIIGPAIWLGTLTAENLQNLARNLADGTISIPPPRESVKDWPVVGERLMLFWSTAYVDLQAALEPYRDQIRNLGRAALGAGANVGIGLIHFILALILAGFLFGRAEGCRSAMTALAKRSAGESGEDFVQLFISTTRNVANGVVGVAVLQSLLVGIGLVSAGIPAAGILTFIALILSAVRIGPGLIVIPAVIYSWTTGDTVTSIILTVYMVPVLLVDNVLTPIVMGRGLPVPVLVVFVGVIGGTLAAGLVGLFIGPVVLAVGYQLLVAWIGSSPPPREPAGGTAAASGPGTGAS